MPTKHTHFRCETWTQTHDGLATRALCKIFHFEGDPSYASKWEFVNCPACIKVKGREVNYKMPTGHIDKFLEDVSCEVFKHALVSKE